jgi:hypothetical protein
MKKEYDYKQEESDAFGSIKRPRIEMRTYVDDIIDGLLAMGIKEEAIRQSGKQ